MKPTSILVALAILVPIFGKAGPATAQQNDPGQITQTARDLNDSFADPDAQRWVARFERDGRAV